MRSAGVTVNSGATRRSLSRWWTSGSPNSSTSKSRVLQEQGRVQLNKPWGKPKNEQCKGFSIAEFQRLDLSKMDFTEVYADFLDAAKLPDEVQTMTEIQSKIQNYYDLHGGKP